jgi:hypothetical protein
VAGTCWLSTTMAKICTNKTILTPASKDSLLATWVHGQWFAGCAPARGASTGYNALLRTCRPRGSARNGHPGEPGEMGRLRASRLCRL